MGKRGRVKAGKRGRVGLRLGKRGMVEKIEGLRLGKGEGLRVGNRGRVRG